MLSYRSTHHSFDCDETFRSCCKRARGGFRNLIYIQITVCVRLCVCVCVCECVCVSRIGAHTVHPIAMKPSQVVVNIPAVVLEIKKI